MDVQLQSGKMVSFSRQNIFCEFWRDLKYPLLPMRSGKSQETRPHRLPWALAKIAKKAFLRGEGLKGMRPDAERLFLMPRTEAYPGRSSLTRGMADLQAQQLGPGIQDEARQNHAAFP